jgi:hypothetical protein
VASPAWACRTHIPRVRCERSRDAGFDAPGRQRRRGGWSARTLRRCGGTSCTRRGVWAYLETAPQAVKRRAGLWGANTQAPELSLQRWKRRRYAPRRLRSSPPEPTQRSAGGCTGTRPPGHGPTRKDKPTPLPRELTAVDACTRAILPALSCFATEGGFKNGVGFTCCGCRRPVEHPASGGYGGWTLNLPSGGLRAVASLRKWLTRERGAARIQAQSEDGA